MKAAMSVSERTLYKSRCKFLTEQQLRNLTCNPLWYKGSKEFVMGNVFGFQSFQLTAFANFGRKNPDAGLSLHGFLFSFHIHKMMEFVRMRLKHFTVTNWTETSFLPIDHLVSECDGIVSSFEALRRILTDYKFT